MLRYARDSTQLHHGVIIEVWLSGIQHPPDKWEIVGSNPTTSTGDRDSSMFPRWERRVLLNLGRKAGLFLWLLS